jgi:hypothetical protein
MESKGLEFNAAVTMEIRVEVFPHPGRPWMMNK